MKWPLGVVALPGLLLFFLFGYPAVVLLGQGVSRGAPVLGEPFLRHVLRFTLLQAFASACLSALLGTVAAVLYSENRFAGRTLLWRVSLVGFALPPILVALLFAALWGGFDGFYGWAGILAAHVFFNFPLFFRYVGSALESGDRAEELAALSLGASRMRTFGEITWPKIAPAFRSAFGLSFLYCATSFSIVLLLGGNPRFTTIEVAIYQALTQEADLPLAARLAAIQAVATLLLYTFLPNGSRVRAAYSERWLPLYRFHSAHANLFALVMMGTVLLILVVAPLVSLGVDALSAHWRWGELGYATMTSVKIAVVAGLFSAALALAFSFAARKVPRFERVISLSCGLPLAFSPILLSLAWRLAYPELAASWRGAWLPVALLHGIAGLPLGYRALQDGWDRITLAFERSAVSLGASPSRAFFLLELPLLRRPLVAAAALGGALSMGEVGAVLLFFDESLETLPLKIYREMGRYHFDDAYAAGFVLLIAISALAVVAGAFADRKVKN